MSTAVLSNECRQFISGLNACRPALSNHWKKTCILRNVFTFSHSVHALRTFFDGVLTKCQKWNHRWVLRQSNFGSEVSRETYKSGLIPMLANRNCTVISYYYYFYCSVWSVERDYDCGVYINDTNKILIKCLFVYLGPRNRWMICFKWFRLDAESVRVRPDGFCNGVIPLELVNQLFCHLIKSFEKNTQWRVYSTNAFIYFVLLSKNHVCTPGLWS